MVLNGDTEQSEIGTWKPHAAQAEIDLGDSE